MVEFWTSFLSNPMAIPIIAIVMGIGVPVITACWCEREKHREECKLKRTMIERGMSVDDIERVLAAKSTGKKKHHDSRGSSGNGPNRDWILDCDAQLAVYSLLTEALSLIP